jgi:pimeloyl-ACP methyl ester carboxylesterase
MNTVAVLYIHGINVDQADYADDLHLQVTRNVKRLMLGAGEPPRIVTRSVCWWDVFGATAALLKMSTHKKAFGWLTLRDLMLTTAAQAVGYEDGKGDGNYEMVHQRISDALTALELEAPGAPLLIVAHSLGTIVASNYIWDNRDKLQHLQGLITMGSPLALYAGRYSGFGQAVDLQGRPWFNLLYPSDVIGWPLRDLNKSYNLQVTEDIVLTPGWFTGKSPLSHTHYWGSGEVAAIVGDMVFKLADDGRG